MGIMEQNATLIIVIAVIALLVVIGIGRAIRNKKTAAEATPGKAGKRHVSAQFSQRGH
jgi:hypothetical protein